MAPALRLIRKVESRFASAMRVNCNAIVSLSERRIFWCVAPVVSMLPQYFTSPSGEFATVNVNAIRGVLIVADADPTTYDGESPEQRKARREDQWTPVVKVA